MKDDDPNDLIAGLADIKASIDGELKQVPQLHDSLLVIQQRLIDLKAIIKDIIANAPGTKGLGGCDEITFWMNEIGLFHYRCSAYGLVKIVQDEEYLTELGEYVSLKLNECGVMRVEFVYSEYPW